MDISSLITLNTTVAGLISSSAAGSSPFNLIRAAVRGKLHETSHSRILGELLGCDSGILKSFLDTFIRKGLYNKEDKWDVMIERDNIDVTVQGRNHVIIIENKVNNAPEQYRQIDRYVELKSAGEKSTVYVLYLSGMYPLLPSGYSLCDAKDKCTILSKTYSEDVREWIGDLLQRHNMNYSIHTALYHYKNYLDYMYESDSTSGISAEIRSEIENYIKTSTRGTDEISALENLSNELYATAEICKKLMYEKKWVAIQDKINTQLVSQGLPRLLSSQEMNWDMPDAGIEFTIEGLPNKFYAVVSYLHQRYIGIIDHDNKGQLDDEIVTRLKEVLKGMSSEPSRLTDASIYSTFRYPYWFKVDSYEGLKDQYLQLVKNLKNNDAVTIIDRL